VLDDVRGDECREHEETNRRAGSVPDLVRPRLAAQEADDVTLVEVALALGGCEAWCCRAGGGATLRSRDACDTARACCQVLPRTTLRRSAHRQSACRPWQPCSATPR